MAYLPTIKRKSTKWSYVCIYNIYHTWTLWEYDRITVSWFTKRFVREHLSKSNDVECLHFTVHRSLYAHLPKKHHNLEVFCYLVIEVYHFIPIFLSCVSRLTHEYALNLKETNPIIESPYIKQDIYKIHTVHLKCLNLTPFTSLLTSTNPQQFEASLSLWDASRKFRSQLWVHSTCNFWASLVVFLCLWLWCLLSMYRTWDPIKMFQN